MSARMATLDLPKIKLFWNKGYDVMVFVYDLSNNILSRDLILQMSLCDACLITLAFLGKQLS